jgi:hypothetical protein
MASAVSAPRSRRFQFVFMCIEQALAYLVSFKYFAMPPLRSPA